MIDGYQLLRRLLFCLPAETAHRFTLNCLHYATSIGAFTPPIVDNPVTVMGLTFPNRVGIAAGLDKNGKYVPALACLGVGFIEVGSVSPQARVGNPKPRLFRLVKHKAIINRIGLANDGVDVVAERLKAVRVTPKIGVNISNNKDSQDEQLVKDYEYCFQKVADVADYVTLNISCPHEQALQALQFDDVKKLLAAMKQQQSQLARYTPIVVKISPDMSVDQMRTFAKILIEFEIDGVIATNTTNRRDDLDDEPLAKESGGLSGEPLFKYSLQAVNVLTEMLPQSIPIIAVGGIDSEKRAAQMFAAGASLVQVYTGLVYQGPKLIQSIGYK